MSGARALFTIGYERTGLPGLIEALKAADVATVIDVREIANSRRAGFAKTMLSRGLAEAGIRYVHLRALGTPKAGRDANRRGDMASFRRIVAEALERPEAALALAEAAEIARAGRSCLLCLEHDWRICHRAEVAARLEPMGFAATHLTAE